MDMDVKGMLENGREGCAHEFGVCDEIDCGICVYLTTDCTAVGLEQVFCKKCGKGKKDEQ